MCQKFPSSSSSIQIQKYSRSILALFIALVLGRAECVKQELWMHMRGGYVLYFDSHNSNLTSVSSLFPIKKLCAVGRWHLFAETNFKIAGYCPRAGSLNNEVFCQDYTTTHVQNSASIKSVRRIGGSDTTNETLSLYSGTHWTGNEIFVTSEEKAKVGISKSSEVNSISYIGSSSNWTLFEGQHLNGKSKCFSGSRIFNFGNNLKNNLETVGSVFYGCDAEEIKRYRLENLK